MSHVSPGLIKNKWATAGHSWCCFFYWRSSQRRLSKTAFVLQTQEAWWRQRRNDRAGGHGRQGRNSTTGHLMKYEMLVCVCERPFVSVELHFHRPGPGCCSGLFWYTVHGNKRFSVELSAFHFVWFVWHWQTNQIHIHNSQSTTHKQAKVKHEEKSVECNTRGNKTTGNRWRERAEGLKGDFLEGKLIRWHV